MTDMQLEKVMSNISLAKKDEKDNVRLVHRDDIPGISSIVVDGHRHQLGLLLDFHKHPELGAFIPEAGRFSVSWTRLKKNEELTTHRHPTSSMIIICEGEGQILGDLRGPLKAGDIALIPPNCAHGFIGKGKEGFWALSIQFEGQGLYENRDSPRVKFEGKNKLEGTFAQLEADQEEYEQRFMKNPLMKLIRSSTIKKPEVQDRLLEALNYWSDWFQKILALRVATGAPPLFQSSAEQHLAEEVGHNRGLFVLRKNAPMYVWDPLLDASASWFYQRMITGRPGTKAVLMHCVCESASYIFHTEAKRVFSSMPHFTLHSDLDEGHAAEGFHILKTIPGLDIYEMRLILKHGWDVFENLASAMAAYAIQGGDSAAQLSKK
jgi:quercetin dioxygenase-like cupin family protein